ncbi:hypothetical protein [Dactylosporangium darangshiense]|uniref:hypothetical protein n=1 Tax=Dactylosporangium darangshiense TaxID=579108 RepID=UPI003641EB80
MAAAFAAQEWRTPWAGGGALKEALERLDAESADALAVALLDGGSASAGRVRLAGALSSRFRAKRSAPTALMPLTMRAADRVVTHSGLAVCPLVDDVGEKPPRSVSKGNPRTLHPCEIQGFMQRS